MGRTLQWSPVSSIKRFASTAASNNNKYSPTLFLPKTSFPIRPSAAQSIAPFGRRTSEELYNWQWEHCKTRPLFILHDGPPYANGSLHMGHALNKILKDIILRYKLLRGHRVHYRPGWDCHGLPIENKALENLGIEDSRNTSPEVIRTSAEKTGKSQFKQFGIMANWDSQESTYRTIDHDYEMRQLHVFKQMVEQGLIYRNYRPVYFSPSSGSALAEAELEYNDKHVSHSVYVTFDLGNNPWGDGPVKLLVWTTTPWTLTANMGIAVNPEMAYSLVKLQDSDSPMVVATENIEELSKVLGPIDILRPVEACSLIGLPYQSLFPTNSSLPLHVMSSSHVKPLSGTGLVHCAPAHGAEDYNLFRARGLLSRAEDIFLIGKPVLDEGSRSVVDLLKVKGQLVKIKRYQHSYPYDWRTKKPVIFLTLHTDATSQWFANLENVKGRAIEAASNVQHIPAQASNRLQAFLSSRTEWCISRQRVWEPVLTSDSLAHILRVLDAKGTNYWWTGPVEDFIPPSYRDAIRQSTWRKGTDTMDVWFDSGTSWSMLQDENGRQWKADVCLEGSDQHRGWFQSQLLTKLGTSIDNVEAPYKTLITHGMMSKSLGNVMDPLVLVNGGDNIKVNPAYGPDLLRFWAANVDVGKDVLIGKKQLAQVSEALRKLRNTARFALSNIGTEKFVPIPFEEMPLLDRYILAKLSELERKALAAYESYQFPQVVSQLNHFVNITLSSLYFDVNKDTLYADALDSSSRRTVITVLTQVLESMTRIMAPILPHLAEEIYHHMNFSHLPINSHEEEMGNEVQHQMALLLKIRTVVLSLLEKARQQMLLNNSLEAEVVLVLPGDHAMEQDAVLLEENNLAKLFIVSDVEVTDEGSFGTSSPPWTFVDTVNLPGWGSVGVHLHPARHGKCPRCWKYTRETSQDLCERCDSVVAGQSHGFGDHVSETSTNPVTD
ncbi:tRNA synthetases class I-domain-containing protein [Flagelloscypha sp. PMI_526]|nr:tRNA synthetases class I-domain-containing protein [Flagelloscypha sp. PMI_526]